MVTGAEQQCRLRTGYDLRSQDSPDLAELDPVQGVFDVPDGIDWATLRSHDYSLRLRPRTRGHAAERTNLKMQVEDVSAVSLASQR